MTLAGASAYYYVIDEYKLGNDMLTEDIYVSLLVQSLVYKHLWLGHNAKLAAPSLQHVKRSPWLTSAQVLQASVQRLHDHITELENKAAQDPSKK